MGSVGLSTSLQTVNERSAWNTLDSFLTERGAAYSGGISSPNTAFRAGSRLSPHLAWGTISAGSVFLALDQRRADLSSETLPNPWKKSLRAFESRLHWRDHFVQRLEGCPAMEFSAINPAFNEVKYRDHPEHLVVHVNVFEPYGVNIFQHFIREQRLKGSVTDEVTNHHVVQSLSLSLCNGETFVIHPNHFPQTTLSANKIAGL